MKITQDQLRKAAQLLRPGLWQNNRMAALIETLEILHEASMDSELRPPEPAQTETNNDEIAQLEAFLQEKQIHITAAARAIGVNQVTLYSWFHRESQPRADNLTKIRAFLSKANA
jgi:hypothetical protein